MLNIYRDVDLVTSKCNHSTKFIMTQSHTLEHPIEQQSCCNY